MISRAGTGKLAAEYSTTTNALTGLRFLTQDIFGSTRLITDVTGADLRRYDYLPFGEEIPSAIGGRAGFNYGISGTSQKFSGKERDAETTLDSFGARYHSSTQGRWTSVDPTLQSALLEHPGSWNRYTYVYNQPLTIVDPDGQCPACIGFVVGGIAQGHLRSHVPAKNAESLTEQPWSCGGSIGCFTRKWPLLPQTVYSTCRPLQHPHRHRCRRHRQVPYASNRRSPLGNRVCGCTPGLPRFLERISYRAAGAVGHLQQRSLRRPPRHRDALLQCRPR